MLYVGFNYALYWDFFGGGYLRGEGILYHHSTMPLSFIFKRRPSTPSHRNTNSIAIPGYAAHNRTCYGFVRPLTLIVVGSSMVFLHYGGAKIRNLHGHPLTDDDRINGQKGIIRVCWLSWQRQVLSHAEIVSEGHMPYVLKSWLEFEYYKTYVKIMKWTNLLLITQATWSAIYSGNRCCIYVNYSF